MECLQERDSCYIEEALKEVRRIESRVGGITYSERIDILRYADDVILAESEEDLEVIIRMDTVMGEGIQYENI